MLTICIVFKDGSFESYDFVSFVRSGHKLLYFFELGVDHQLSLADISYFNVF